MNKHHVLLSLSITFLTIGSIEVAFSEQLESNVIIGGDFRYRHELIDVEKSDMRNMHRIRARLNMTAQLNDDMKGGFQLATGNDDPVSTNQTLTGGFSSKPILLDLAYFDWQPRFIDGCTVLGGKIKNPFYSPGNTELMWDSDLRPEGIAVTYLHTLDTITMFVNTSYFWVEERKEYNDAVLIGGQTGINYTSFPLNFLLGLGYFDFQNTRKYPPFFDTGDSSGNTVNANGSYLYDYKEFEISSEISLPRVFTDASVFCDYVANIAEDVADNRGWLIGFSAGVCKEPGSISLRYSYRYLEKDAVIGAFTDSDFIGGGTDGKGHEVNVEFQLTQKTKGEISYFANKTNIDNCKDYHRMQVEVNFKF